MSTPTIPTGLAASDVTASALTLSWDQSTNPGTIMVSGPASGAWLGWGGGSKTDIVATESTLGRTVDFYRTYYNMSGKNGDTFPTRADQVMYSGGKLPSGVLTVGGRLAVWGLTTKVGGGANPERSGLLSAVTPAGSSSYFGGNGVNNVYTYTQIAAGGLDAFWTAEFTRVAAWGHPCWFVFDWEPTRNKRSIDDGGGGGNNADRAAAGTLAEFVDAWQHIHGIAASVGASNVAWLLTYGTGEKQLAVYQSAYPGDEYVDWIGWEPYNNPAPGEQWDDFTATADAYTAITVTTPALGTDTKPVMLAETGCNYDPADPTHRATWLGGIADGVAALPTLKAVTYWNDNSGKNFAKLNVATYANGKWSATDTADVNAWAALTTEVAKPALNQPHTAAGTGVGGYRVYADGGTSPEATTGSATTTSASLTGYAPGSTHRFTVTAVDNSEEPVESAPSAELPVAFLAAQPVAPTVPTDLTATVISDTEIRVTWTTAASQGSGVGGYRLYSNGVFLAQVTPATVTSYAATKLTASTAYGFAISAGDLSLGVWSDQSAVVTATTSDAGKIPAPQGPAALYVSMAVADNTNSPQARLTWVPSYGPTVTGYNIYRDSVLIAQATASTYQYDDVGLRPATDYLYEVTAFDSTKTESISATVVATSPPASSTAPLAALKLTPNAGVAPVTITADASASTDPAGRAILYTFDFGDGPPIGPTAYAAMNNTYVTPGDYQVTVTVTNQPYYFTDTVSVPISVGMGEDRTTELNMYLPRPGDLITSKQFWDQIRADLRTIDQAISDLRNPT